MDVDGNVLGDDAHLCPVLVQVPLETEEEAEVVSLKIPT